MKNITCKTMEDTLVDLYREIESSCNNKDGRNADSTFSWEKSGSIKSGIPEFDKITHGWHAGDLAVITGVNSEALATCSMNIAAHASINHEDTSKLAFQNVDSMFFSLRLPAPLAAMCFLSFTANMNLSLLRSGKCTAKDWHKLARASGCITEQTSIAILSGRIKNLSGIKKICIKKKKKKALNLIVIDGLEALNFKTPIRRRKEEYPMLLQSLKNLAMKIGVVIVVTVPEQIWYNVQSDTLGKPIDTLMYIDEDNDGLGVNICEHHHAVYRTRYNCLRLG